MNKKQVVIVSISVLFVIAMIGLVLASLKFFTHTGKVSAPDYWPSEGWKTNTPEEQGMDSTKLAEALLTIREKTIQVHSLSIFRHGYKVVDATFYPYDGKTVHDVASVTKSVMTTLIGIAIDQGKLRLDDKMVSFFPGFTIANNDQRKNEIAVRHLASMSSGLDCTTEADEKTLKEMQASPDYVQFVLDRPTIYAPGEQFIYCSPAIHLLSPILQEASGQTPLEFARRYLFEPLGIHNATWEQDPQGYYDGWGDLSLLPDDMAKIGFLFLHKGQWNGKQIVSRQWVEAATQTIVATPGGDGYGYGWWMDPAVKGAYRADGRGGQYIFVMPEWDMVIVTTGGGFMMDEIAQSLIASFADFNSPLAANPKGTALLEAALNTVKQPPVSTPVADLPDIAKQISGKTYVFQSNPTTLESISIMFDGSAEATLLVQVAGSPSLSHKVGLDGVFRFSPGFDGRPSAYRGSWVDAQTFLVEYDGIANNDHSFIQVHFEGNQAHVSIQETAHEVGMQIVGQQQE